MTTRGELRVYLGAAPGVGKTYAMLDEGWRRRERGADVVIAVVETHGRPRTAAQLRDLEVVPRRRVEHRGTTLYELDLDAVLARRPDVALVDELAHTNAPGSRHEKRWQDVEVLLSAGINVITTVNVQHLESLNDVVESITGIVQRETVPDAVVRAADQIELVDMSPEALRRRLAHGNVYPAERVDAALTNYFRPGNLGALRELALLWLADRVEDALDRYRDRHRIVEPWETRERVVVALAGAPDGERLIRRAARMAGRARGELIGVHVNSADGLDRRDRDDRAGLEAQRALLARLGGRYHEISGDRIESSLVEFARSQGATQLVLGASRDRGRGRWRTGSVITRTVLGVTGIDVHVIASRDGAGPPARPRARRTGPLPRARVLVGWALVLVVQPLLTALLVGRQQHFSLATDLLIFLGVVVAASAVGGVLPGVVGAVAASLLVNWFLVEPVHTFTIGEPENALSLVVFVAVAATVSGYVDLAARRALDARRAQADAESLARTTAALLSTADPLPEIVDGLRATYRLDGLALLRPSAEGWTVVAGSGDVAGMPGSGRTIASGADTSDVVVARGRPLTAAEERSLQSHAGQLALAAAARERHDEARRAASLESVDELRTAMLRSVSHDLRTPLAGIKTAVSSLLASDVRWTDGQRLEFLNTIDGETDRMARLVDNLLDMSRLQAGAIAVDVGPTPIDDAVARSLDSISTSTERVRVVIPDELPAAHADSVLLERALANVVANALAWSPPSTQVTVSAAAVGTDVAVTVADRGPGIPARERSRVLRPFQRFDDGGSRHGTGLGLAVAEGFVRAMKGQLTLDDTPGGGLTVTIRLPIQA